MNAGTLDRTILINRCSTLPAMGNEYGVIEAVESEDVPMRARLLSSASENITHGSGTITRTVLTFRLRYLDSVNPGDTLKYQGEPYDIATVNEIGRRKGLELTAIKRNAP